MKKYWILPFLSLCIFTSCGEADEPALQETRNEKTLLIYMPWSSNLTSYFYQNIRDMESCIQEMGGLENERVLVFISETSSEASL